MPPVVIVQHEGSVPAGNIKAVLEQDGVDHVVIEAWRSDLPHVDDVGALVVLGGTMNVDELDAYPFLKGSRELMTSALERGVPTLGVCLGSQMMARVLDAEVRRAPARNAYFSPLEITEEGAGDPVMEPFTGGRAVLQFHEDTFELPDEAVLLATSSRSGLSQAFRYGENAYAVQFHFEVDDSIVQGWVRNIGEPSMTEGWGTSTDELGRQGAAHLDAQDLAGRKLFRNFLRLAR